MIRSNQTAVATTSRPSGRSRAARTGPAQLALEGLARRFTRHTAKNIPGTTLALVPEDPRQQALRRQARALWIAIDRMLTTKYRLVRELQRAEDISECVALGLLIARADYGLVDLDRDLTTVEEELHP